MAEEMGQCLFGSEPFNCSPPDTGKINSCLKDTISLNLNAFREHGGLNEIW